MEKKELFSSLPEELIHRILGFLSTKDAVKASFVSKSLQASWLSSCPSLDFHEKDDLWRQEPVDLQKFNRFHKYVAYNMERVSNHSRRITSFKFQTPYLLHTETESYLLINKWISIALDCHVREICLTLWSQQGRLVPNVLFERVLSSSFLESLSLVWRGYELNLPPLARGGGNLPCLQSLTLVQVRIDQEVLQRLLKGCPSLEYLEIRPGERRLSEVNISHLKLKSLVLSNDGHFRKVEVDAPCLDKFEYKNPSDEADVIVKSSTLKNLKFLSLFIYTIRSKEWLYELLPKCTSLETLRILLWPDDVTIKISSPYVKNIAIEYRRVTKIEIDCPMLLSLCWIARGCRLLLPSLSVINHQPNFVGHLHIKFWSHHTDLNTAWFHKLKEFFSISRIAAMSFRCLLHSVDQEPDDQNADSQSLPTSAVKIKLLYLMVSSGLSESHYSFIMNDFLSTCHPDTIHLAPPLPEEEEEEEKQPMHFIEFFLEKLENWKDADGCYCSSKIKCWKHQLKAVEIQEFSKLEDKLERDDQYNFDDMPNYALLPLPQFCLKFQWTN